MQLRIGTRKSTLALAQAEIVKQKLLAAFPELKAEIVPFVTSGDRSTSPTLADIGGKGLFTREIEESLLRNEIDIAVHSLKDMESHLPPGLLIAATIERADPRDVMVSPLAGTITALKKGASVGTSSPRRTVQLKLLRPDLDVVPFRGNVPTRLTKLKDGVVDATLLALAGLARLGRQGEVTEILDVEHFTPAAGQGTIAIECRENNEAVRTMLQSIDHASTHNASLAERSVLAAIGGSCRTAIASYAWLEGDALQLRAMFAKPDATQHAKVSRAGRIGDALAMGKDAGKELLTRGSKDWL